LTTSLLACDTRRKKKRKKERTEKKREEYKETRGLVHRIEYKAHRATHN